MPVTNTYRRYIADGTFGIIASDSVPIKYVRDMNGKAGKLCVTGAGSNISLWNLHTSLSVR